MKKTEQQFDFRERLIEVRKMRAGEIQENPRNPKIHPEQQTAPLAGILSDVGKVDILKAYYSERAGGALVYWDGHARRNLNLDEEWNVGIYDLTDAEADYLLATFDPVGWQAQQSAIKLNDLLRDVSTGQASVMEMLAREAERCGAIAELENKPQPGAGGDEFDVTPEEEQTRVQYGDLWQCGEHRVLCGDSTKAEDVARVMSGEKANAVLTDPPYGINQDGVTNDEPEKLAGLVKGSIGQLPINQGVIVAFQSTRTFPLWLDEVRTAGFHFERMLWLYKEAQCTFPWRGWILKSESILVATKGQGRWNEVKPYSHDCYKVPEVSGEIPEGMGWHGSVKPLAVIADIAARISQEGDLIYEPFGGSGTTLIACERTNRKARVIEIEPKYVNVILSRWEAETGKQAQLLERIEK